MKVNSMESKTLHIRPWQIFRWATDIYYNIVGGCIVGWFTFWQLDNRIGYT